MLEPRSVRVEPRRKRQARLQVRSICRDTYYYNHIIFYQSGTAPDLKCLRFHVVSQLQVRPRVLLQGLLDRLLGHTQP